MRGRPKHSEREEADRVKPFRKHYSGEVIMDYENDSVGGYAVPVDPMDLLQCDSCQ
jgi:hypothetical protein